MVKFILMTSIFSCFSKFNSSYNQTRGKYILIKYLVVWLKKTALNVSELLAEKVENEQILFQMMGERMKKKGF